MENLRSKTENHLKAAGKTYWQHLYGASKTAVECFHAGAAAIIHGVLPFLFEHTASDKIRKMYSRQNPDR